MFNRSAGGSIGGGFASFLCLKRLSVLSCRVRSTSTTFRSSISDIRYPGISTRALEFYLPFRNTRDRIFFSRNTAPRIQPLRSRLSRHSSNIYHETVSRSRVAAEEKKKKKTPRGGFLSFSRYRGDISVCCCANL